MNWEHFLNKTKDMLCVSDRQGRFVWTNERWSEVLGYTMDELEGQAFIELVHPDDVGMTLETYASIMGHTGGETHGITKFVNRYRHADGSYVWLEWNVSQPVDGNVYAIVRDVSERIRRERLKAEQIALVEAIEAQTNVGRWRVDLTTGHATWSSSIFEITGLAPRVPAPTLEETVELYLPEDRHIVSGSIEAAAQHGEYFSIEARLARPTGEVRRVSVYGMVVQEAGQPPTVMHGHIRDITHERAQAERLVHTERLATIGQMAAGVAHEINNPLQSMTMNLELLRDELAQRASASELESMRAALEGAERVRKIVEVLRRFARKPSHERERISSAKLLEGVMRLVRGRHEGVRLESHVDHGLPDVEVAEQAISQALLNLVTNACQSVSQTGLPGHVRVSVKTELRDAERVVVFEVEDEGVGLEVEEPERVFEPFFTTKAAGVGTGLGLSITRGLVAAHGGDVTLANRRDAQGAVARLTLPAAEGGTEAPSVDLGPSLVDVTSGLHAPETPEAKPTSWVLIVDDEPSIVRTLSRYLSKRGYDVMTASGGHEALEVLEQKPRWGLILCDLKMPDLGGKELRELLLERLPHLEPRLHFMTGDSWSADNQAFLSQLGRPHLDKPFVISELKSFVQANWDG